MDTILKFLKRYSAFLTFLLFSIVAFVIIGNKSIFQRSMAINAGLEINSTVNARIASMREYLSLKSTNEALLKSNTQLLEHVNYLDNIIKQQNYEIHFSQDTIMKFISAKVIQNSVNNIDNYLIINKGEKDGVKEGFGVISDKGVVGVVKTVSKNYSLVLSVLSSKLNLSGRLKKSNYMCNVYWNGLSVSLGKAKNIPKHIQTNIGDTVVTSGYSTIFPENIVIGTVKTISPNKASASNDLTVKFSTDFMNINYVNIVIFNDLQEVTQLNNQIQNERKNN